MVNVEETKRKYLDMLTTKIFLNEDEVAGLAKWSLKKVIVVCPFCGKQKSRRHADITQAGHTLCPNCSKSIKTNVSLLGIRKGRLLIYDFTPSRQGETKWKAQLKAICDCGTDKSYLANDLSKTSSCGCFRKDTFTGEGNPNYNPNLTEEERRKNRDGRQASWSKAVRKRDNYTCQVCGSAENLVAHHLNSYKDNKENRFDLENGITLCRECHTDFHCNFMGDYRQPCNEENFEQYLLQV